VAAFAVLAGLFALRMMGGGDVKLLTALALWVPFYEFMQLLLIMSLAGGALTIVLAAWHVMRRQKDKLKIPYGVAIAFGGLWVLAINYLPGGIQAAGAA
jgi:prepilin peptidase CpaA